MNLTSLVSKSMVVAVVGLCLSCKERLPSYEDPTQIFSGILRPTYQYSGTQNSLNVQLVVVNDFDETFEGRTLFEGTVEIVLARKPDLKKTFFLSSSNLIQGKYNAGSRVLTLDPGDSVRVRVSWNFVDDQGTDLRQQEFSYRTDQTCFQRRIAGEEVFTITGRLKLYDRTEEIKFGPVIYAICHINAWVDPRFCPTITPEEACRVR